MRKLSGSIVMVLHTRLPCDRWGEVSWTLRPAGLVLWRKVWAPHGDPASSWLREQQAPQPLPQEPEEKISRRTMVNTVEGVEITQSMDLALRKPQSISQGLDSDCGGWTDLEAESNTEEGGRLVAGGGHRQEDGLYGRESGADIDAETRIRRECAGSVGRKEGA